MAVVVEASAFAGAFFICYNMSTATPPASFMDRYVLSGGFYFAKNIKSLIKVLTYYSICTIIYIESKKGRQKKKSQGKEK